MSSKFATVTNRFITAAMLVAMLIACQEMPENNGNSNSIPSEQPQN